MGHEFFRIIGQQSLWRSIIQTTKTRVLVCMPRLLLASVPALQQCSFIGWLACCRSIWSYVRRHGYPLHLAVFASVDIAWRQTLSSQWQMLSVAVNIAEHSSNCCQLGWLHEGRSTPPYNGQLRKSCDVTQAPRTTQPSAELSLWRRLAGTMCWTTFAAQCPHCRPLSLRWCRRVALEVMASCSKPCASFLNVLHCGSHFTSTAV